MPDAELVVFISHATADNERFVVPFNAALAGHGLRTIVDVQNFRPGDSLITSIFDRGIYEANAVVIVVSGNTGGRPHVRAELEHAVLRHIEESIPVITVVLDGAEIPPPLRTQLQIRLAADRSPEDVAEEVARTLLGRRDQTPPVTAAPETRWALATVRGIADATPLDEYVGRYALEQALTKNYEYVDVAALAQEIRQTGQGDEEDLEASLYAMEHDGLIEREHEMGTRLPVAFKLTECGAVTLLQRYVPDLLQDTRKAIIERLKHDYPLGCEISSLAADLGTPQWLIFQIGKELEARGAAHVEQYIGGWGDIAGTPAIRRF